ncbi:MAG: CocE/NonD family hydrolase, partial [Actinomycetota bacterium]|nr:CocE/NonD family hydrolase [Actinomycetota bacterium]
MQGTHFRKALVAAVAVIALAFAGLATTGTASASTDGASASAAATISKLTGKQKRAKKKAIRKCRTVLKKQNKRARKLRGKRAKKVRRANKRRAKKCIKRVKKKYNRISKRQWRQSLPGTPAPKANAPATYTARGSVGEAYVTGASEGDTLLLVSKYDRTIRTGVADRFGSKIFYDVKPDKGYTVRMVKDGKVQGTKKFKILNLDENPNQSFYKNKVLKQGLNYVTMRDGVELAMTVRLPTGKTLADGPFPVLIEHSGYGTAAPHNLLQAVLANTGDPLAPDTSTAVGALIGPEMGFAVVSVQMRGSGCSGGAFDLFGLPTTYDGYDMVETVGNQAWAKKAPNGKGNVGLVGISFSGISQLFAAGTQPPHLAAITPMSVTD